MVVLNCGSYKPSIVDVPKMPLNTVIPHGILYLDPLPTGCSGCLSHSVIQDPQRPLILLGSWDDLSYSDYQVIPQATRIGGVLLYVYVTTSLLWAAPRAGPRTRLAPARCHPRLTQH